MYKAVVEEEYKELSVKIENLEKELEENAFKCKDIGSRLCVDILEDQLRAMQEYKACLRKRYKCFT